ncbi:MAG: 60S ribosomal protein L22 [Promethearchaeota archaeon]
MTYVIVAEDLSKKKGQFFVDLTTYLEEKLPRYMSISTEGSDIVIATDSPERKFSKRTLRQLIRKHLHNVRLKGELKVIAGEKDEYIIKKRKGIELEIEEEEEEES